MSQIPTTQSPEAPPRAAPTSAPPLARLAPALDRHLADACRLVAAAPTIATTVALVADLDDALDADTAWLACDRRVAELVQEYGVEVWLAQEDQQVRVRIERYEPALPPLPASAPVPARGDAAGAPADVAPPAARRWAGLRRWWRGRGGR
ncbi:MAG TPA: hypothetical protein VFW96_14820 [Thermomicrobiales bacterium]|nr:hypothetical protein [Thermomicrobiales bacterium]